MLRNLSERLGDSQEPPGRHFLQEGGGKDGGGPTLLLPMISVHTISVKYLKNKKIYLKINKDKDIETCISTVYQSDTADKVKFSIPWDLDLVKVFDLSENP